MNITQDYTTLELVERWEARRELRNLMGKMTQDVLHGEEAYFFERYWSKRSEDVCLGTNDGWYLGPHAVKEYYRSVADEIRLADETLRRRFPQIMGEGYGLGQFNVKPLSSDLVEIAGDGRTAKGMWSCQGSDVRMTVKGPLSFWTVGIYAADFVLEDGKWLIWHLQELRDIDCPCGEQWWQPRRERPDELGFEAMAAAGRPEPTIKTPLRSLWTREMPRQPMPECPKAYRTFEETFSYGYVGGADHA